MKNIVICSISALCALAMVACLILMFTHPKYIITSAMLFCVYGAIATIILYHNRDRE